MLRFTRGRRKGVWKVLDAEGWAPGKGENGPGAPSNQAASLLITHLRELSPGGETPAQLDRLPWLVCAFLSYRRPQAIARQAKWLPWEEKEPQEERGSDCTSPTSTPSPQGMMTGAAVSCYVLTHTRGNWGVSRAAARALGPVPTLQSGRVWSSSRVHSQHRRAPI